MVNTILITGATSGFGRACAERFAAAGWRMILCGRRLRLLEECRDAWPDVEILPLQLDVRDRQAVEKMAASLPEPFASVDVLINNAGLALGMEGADSAILDDWETMIDTNIKGLCFLTRTFLPQMVARNAGHIVNLGSIAGNYPYPGGNAYGATKAFVKQFSRNLLCDLVHTGVRVTNIEPGLAESEFSTVRFHGDIDRARKVYAGTKPLTPKDIAEIIWWVVTVPAHININTVEVMPACQACGPLAIHRQPVE